MPQGDVVGYTTRGCPKVLVVPCRWGDGRRGLLSAGLTRVWQSARTSSTGARDGGSLCRKTQVGSHALADHTAAKGEGKLATAACLQTDESTNPLHGLPMESGVGQIR